METEAKEIKETIDEKEQAENGKETEGPNTSKKATPKKSPGKKLSRKHSMAVTAAEGQELLKEEGASDLMHAKGRGPETRSKRKARAALDTMLDNAGVGDSKAEAEESETFSSPTKTKAKAKAKASPAKAKKEPKSSPKAKGKKGTKRKGEEEAEEPLLSPEEEEKTKKELAAVFRLFDQDRNGRIDALELAEMMRALGKRPLKAKIRAVIEAADADNSGSIDQQEFINYMLTKKKNKLKKKKAKADASAAEPAVATTSSTSSSSSSSAPAPAPAPAAKSHPPLKKGPSILNYYTLSANLRPASLSPEQVTLDQHNNPVGADYDLGRDEAFKEFLIIVYVAAYVAHAVDNPKKALSAKGFQLEFITDIQEFVKRLPSADAAWILSAGNQSSIGGVIQDWSKISKADFVKAVLDFHNSGKGLAIWADNEPLFIEANAILESFGVELVGNTPGGKTLKSSDDPKQSGHFGKHVITSGIETLYEGTTISHPKDNNPGKLQVLATSSDDHPVILYSDFSNSWPPAGRIVVDCAYTKLWHGWELPGNSRYITNMSVWLLGLDYRLARGYPVKGALNVISVKHVWQYLHKGWNNYEDTASDVVEEAYHKFLSGGPEKVMVKSGFFEYEVDLKALTQKNLTHEAHNVRAIRRTVLAH